MSTSMKNQKLDLTKGKKYIALLTGDMRPSRITIEDHKKTKVTISYLDLNDRMRKYASIEKSDLELMMRLGRERAKELRSFGSESKDVPKRRKGQPAPTL